MNNIISVYPQDGNMTPLIQKILSQISNGSTLLFEPGAYHFYKEGTYTGDFYPSNNAAGTKNVVFLFRDKKDITLMGPGAEFIFHEEVFPFIFQHCQNILIKDITVDFAFPRVYQATVLEAGNEYLDIFIDQDKFPCSVCDGELVLHLEQEDLTPESIYFFPYDAKFDRTYAQTPTRYNMAYFSMGANCRTDGSMGGRSWSVDNRYFQTDASQIAKNTVRFTYRQGSNRMYYDKGDRLVLHYHRLRDNGTYFLEYCKNVCFENDTIYRGGCMGITAQMCENMTVTNMHIGCKEGRGDLISTTADALMFIDCRGRIDVKNCYIADSLDDGINVHGTYMPTEEISGNSVTHILTHVEQCGFNPIFPGDRVAFVDEKTLDIVSTLTVKSSELLPDKKHIVTVFNEEIPDFVKTGMLLYSLDAMPEMEITDNVFYQVPALLLGTSKRTVFARNKVNTRNEALRLVDCATWVYEMARKNNLIIEDNDFLHCTEWYDLPVIHIVERLQLEKPKYDIHQNMIFRNNRFMGRNCRWFYMECSSNVQICNNTFENTNPSIGLSGVKPFDIRSCQNIVMTDNKLTF